MTETHRRTWWDLSRAEATTIIDEVVATHPRRVEALLDAVAGRPGTTWALGRDREAADYNQPLLEVPRRGRFSPDVIALNVVSQWANGTLVGAGRLAEIYDTRATSGWGHGALTCRESRGRRPGGAGLVPGAAGGSPATGRGRSGPAARG